MDFAELDGLISHFENTNPTESKQHAHNSACFKSLMKPQKENEKRK
jgi:hypothetical protein